MKWLTSCMGAFRPMDGWSNGSQTPQPHASMDLAASSLPVALSLPLFLFLSPQEPKPCQACTFDCSVHSSLCNVQCEMSLEPQAAIPVHIFMAWLLTPGANCIAFLSPFDFTDRRYDTFYLCPYVPWVKVSWPVAVFWCTCHSREQIKLYPGGNKRTTESLMANW